MSFFSAIGDFVGDVVGGIGDAIGDVVGGVADAFQGAISGIIDNPMALVAIGAAVFTGGASLSVLGLGTTGTGGFLANAAIKVAVTNAGVTFARTGDIGEALKAGATSYLTGSVASFAQPYLMSGAAAAGITSELGQQLVQNAGTAAVKTAINGGDIADAVTGSVTGQLAGLAGDYVANSLNDLYEAPQIVEDAVDAAIHKGVNAVASGKDAGDAMTASVVDSIQDFAEDAIKDKVEGTDLYKIITAA